MKKIIWISLLIILVLAFGYAYNKFSKTEISPETKTGNTKTIIKDNYLGSEFKGNYVWGGAMNLAWNELGEKIIKEKIKLNTQDAVALEMVKKLNDSVFSRNDLDEESYYIKAGYGQKTVDEINRESKKKFPTKSFKDLKLDLSPKDIISYAYFLKEIEYKEKFKKDDIYFEDERVKGFVADTVDQRKIVKVLNYENDDKFIVKIDLKKSTLKKFLTSDDGDEIFLVKGYDMNSPVSAIKDINLHNKNNLEYLKSDELFEVPAIHLDMHRDYNELIDKFLTNAGFQTYKISQMYENIKFDMDEAGARVENEAVIVMLDTAVVPDFEIKKPRTFILDKPYWIIMKRKNSQNPYFILGIKNTELMKRQ